MTPKIHIACPDSTFYGIRRHTFWALILPIGDAHCTLSQLVTGYPYTRKVPYKAVKCHLGAENGARTRDLNLGKVALYQLSYFRNITPYLAVGITKVRSFF